jgi:tetratricopeptide (TPR) repeat protein
MCICPVISGLVELANEPDLFQTRSSARVQFTPTRTPTPLTAKYYFDRGIQQYKAENYDLAIDYLSRTIEIDPNYRDAYFNRARAYRGLGEFKLAIADYSKAIELEPSAAAYNNRGNAYRYLGDFKQAIADFNTAIEIRPDYALAYSNRGDAHLGAGEIEQAFADYERAIELEPDNADHHFWRGGAYYSQGEYELAAADYSRAVDLEPDHTIAHNNLAWTLAYDLDTDYETALEHAQRAVELGSTGANQDTLALVYFKLEQYDKALEHYNAALELEPEQAGSCKRRGDVYLAMGNEEAALADYEMYLSLVTEGPEREPVEEIVKLLRE